ncbi:MAG: SigE family RNA polymerase sigma factor [Nocardioides sp.]|uniref:SigE family RNA polymerase sigma factor n=1 Tax=Nocardioides sp. TaxID=35761 RepID=UPI0039E4A590
MDADEFDEFYLATYPRLVGQLIALTGVRTESEECVQEAFIRAWQHRGRLDRNGQPEAWVRTTAFRLATSRFRRTARRRRLDGALTPPAPVPGLSEDHVALVDALAKLPEDQRVAIVLHHLADLPVATVAAETNAPVGTVKARLSRGRAALAALLDTTIDDPEVRHA